KNPGLALHALVCPKLGLVALNTQQQQQQQRRGYVEAEDIDTFLTCITSHRSLGRVKSIVGILTDVLAVASHSN
ncbi:hypothetical protein E4U58_007530, partial [Claviceps cyperi]